MRVLAIGDIHGCSAALDALLAAVGPAPGDRIVALGDFVDRGPDSRGVIERLIRLREDGLLVPLRGNHEQMMLRARVDPELRALWLRVGGAQTLASYAPEDRAGGFDDVPAAHWAFLERECATFYETDTHIFVHGGAEPDRPLSHQPAAVLLWEPFLDPMPHRSGKVLICGHTAQRDGHPRDLGHSICIDTWVYGGGWLTCLDVGTRRLWQANQRGDRREGWLEERAREG